MKIDACLPLQLRDYDRFLLLDRTVRENFSDLNTCWVVVPDAEHATLKQRIGGGPYRVVPESSIVPEVYGRFQEALPGEVRLMKDGRLDLSGWYIQQLVKLSIAQLVETDYYLTLDADVLCIRPTRYEDIVRDERALVTTEPFDAHPDWYRNAERILGYRRSGVNYGVTPSVLGKEVVLSLQQYLESRSPASWRTSLIYNTPWTEYTLYHTYLNGKGEWDRYHINGGDDAIYDTFSSLWNKGGDWSISEALKGNAHFLVVQSNTEIPVEQVKLQVESLLSSRARP